MSKLFSGTRVGILGGGQLARMLAEAAHRLGLRPSVLAESADAPAAQVCPERTLGEISKGDALTRFLDGVDYIAFENEFVDTELLAAAAGPSRIARFFPSLPTLSRLRDKLGQKELLRSLGIPSAPFQKLPTGTALPDWLDSLARNGQRWVLKWGCMGYDGKGVFFLDDLAKQREAALDFGRRAKSRGLSLFAEERISFRRELALIGCRAVSGEFISYPLVVSEQQEGICLDISGPATFLGTSPAKEEEAHAFAHSIAEAGKLVGCFALEFFETSTGELLVNEMAPRVHNSGHYTQDACATSQFENHWRAILGLPLGAPDPAPAFLMGNLLGPQGIESEASETPLPEPDPGLHLHWYGKSELRPGRKLGHLNARVSDPRALGQRLAEMRACRARWIAAVQRTKEKRSQ